MGKFTFGLVKAAAALGVGFVVGYYWSDINDAFGDPVKS